MYPDEIHKNETCSSDASNLTLLKSKIESVFLKQEKKVLSCISKAKKSLEESLNWSAIYHQAELLKANYSRLQSGQDAITVYDWMTDQSLVISIDRTLKPQDLLKRWYQKAKKLKLGIEPLLLYIDRLNAKLAEVGNQRAELEICSTWEAVESFSSILLKSDPKPPKQIKDKKQSISYFEFHSASGLKILVGKNAKGNEFLTFSFAHGNDWWLHAHGTPGSHVVIRAEKGKEPDEAALLDAAQLALEKSKMKNLSEGEVCITQKKYIARFKGSRPGQVQVSKHTIKWVIRDEKILKEIKERK